MRKLSKKQLALRAQQVIIRLIECQHDADKLGLHAAARKIDEAKNKTGWELAALLEKNNDK